MASLSAHDKWYMTSFFLVEDVKHEVSFIFFFSLPSFHIEYHFIRGCQKFSIKTPHRSNSSHLVLWITHQQSNDDNHQENTTHELKSHQRRSPTSDYPGANKIYARKLPNFMTYVMPVPKKKYLVKRQSAFCNARQTVRFIRKLVGIWRHFFSPVITHFFGQIVIA